MVLSLGGGLDGLIDINNLDSHLLLSQINLNTRILDILEKLKNNAFEVCTDGSKIAGGVEFSVCILKDRIQQNISSYKLNTDNTVFQAELAAAWAAETNDKIKIFQIVSHPSMP
ncbi:hypothetical protein AVEN_158421-1 [Araneus ventricosus]|uniref:RNase H type-1 domain-containing protein n=1 Tax=Araneus ventricosus TaxID=182803 RepID=A0A4Y2J3I4_ARAVE|nr:hypothetical protein AVEN_158421-1 [Araneus ventricosus]